VSPRLQLRRRGRLIELRVDGTLASAQRSGGAAAGPVWDAIAAPVLLLPVARRRSILILGLGGGTVARIVRSFAPDARIVGVERDPGVAMVAARHFGLGDLGVEVVVDDARNFLERDHGHYDLILEDIFVGPNRSVGKPEGFPEPVLSRALRRLAPGGLFVSNTIHEGPATERALLRHVGHLVSIAVEGYYNHVLVAGPASLSASVLRRALTREPSLARTLSRLSFTTRTAAAARVRRPR
jgi:spermidine synthase